MRAIVPCCGFGTRMGMQPHQAKEMLPDPIKRGRIIDYSIGLCKKLNLDPLFIVRPAKKELIDYLSGHDLEVMEYEPEKEWPTTIVASYEHWHDSNILILPDSRFSPEKDTITYMRRDIENLGCRTSFALHRIEDPSGWGVIQNYTVYEKPDPIHYELQHFKEPYWAWGLIAFNNHEHNRIMFEQLDSMYSLKDDYLFQSSFHYLDTFTDITR